MPEMDAASSPDRDHRAAAVADVLARAVRDGELFASDALRIIRHELRRRNTNRTEAIEVHSTEAQRVINLYGPGRVPRNSSSDALHADHVYPLTENDLRRNNTLELWLAAMIRLRIVVCVTAAENYRLQSYERRGITGPAKYAAADITFTTEKLPWS